MALTDLTYAALQASVKDFLHRADLDTITPDLIYIGEKRIFREVRARQMETTFSDTISSGSLSLPTGYIELKFAYINGSPTQRLKKADSSFIYEKYPTRSSSGKPHYIARDEDSFIFGPYPDSAYTVAGTYYQDLSPVSSSAHDLFTAYPDLFLYAALAEAEPYLKNDQRVSLWEAKYANIRDSINQLRGREAMGGGALNVRPA